MADNDWAHRRRAARRTRLLYHREFITSPPKTASNVIVLRLAVVLLFLLVLAGGGLSAATYVAYTRTTSHLTSPGSIIASVADYGGAQILDRNGSLLYRFSDQGGGIKQPVPLNQINQSLINATVSTEDSTFWTNPGVDIQGVGSAALHNVQSSGDPFSGSGGSAITQQLVKNTLIDPEERTAHSLNRKATEVAYALQLTNSYSKEQILDWYLNTVNYGGVYDGIESAANGYFGIHAKDLDLAQAAVLAGIPQSPADYSPYANETGALQRQAEVLDLMVKHGYITQKQADAAKKEKLSFNAPQQALPLNAPWFVEYVKQRLIEQFGQRCFDTCGLLVKTTIDLNLENKAQDILESNLAKYGDRSGVHNGALISIDAQTGEVLVMQGSRNYDDNSPPIQGKNNFTTAVLQPGSSFKPFVYMTLFMKRGYGPDSVIWDVPYTAPGGYKCEDPVPGNKTQGPIPVRLGLGSSLNCAANRAAAAAGVNDVIDAAHKMGITTLTDTQNYGASIATGGANVTMLDMAYAYTTLARNGSMIGDTPVKAWPNGLRTLDPVVYTSVTDGQGKELYKYEPKTKQVVPAPFPYLVTSIISDCKNRRLIWACGFPEFVLSDGRPVAAKTGTQQGEKVGQTAANWQFMYTPQLVTGGWVGNADRTTWIDVSGSANAVGYSVQQLEDTITKTYELPKDEFKQPSGIVSVKVHVPDGSLGLTYGCGPIESGLFAEGSQPDINNRVCTNGQINVPAEQADTGGLNADGRVCDLSPQPTPGPGNNKPPTIDPRNCIALAYGAASTPTPRADSASSGQEAPNQFQVPSQPAQQFAPQTQPRQPYYQPPTEQSQPSYQPPAEQPQPSYQPPAEQPQQAAPAPQPQPASAPQQNPAPQPARPSAPQVTQPRPAVPSRPSVPYYPYPAPGP